MSPQLHPAKKVHVYLKLGYASALGAQGKPHSGFPRMRKGSWGALHLPGAGGWMSPPVWQEEQRVQLICVGWWGGRLWPPPRAGSQSGGVTAAPQADAGARCDACFRKKNKKKIKPPTPESHYTVAGITHLWIASAVQEQPSPPAPARGPGPRFCAPSLQVNPHPVTSAAAPARHCRSPAHRGPPKLCCGVQQAPTPHHRRGCGGTRASVFILWMDKSGPATGQEPPTTPARDRPGLVLWVTWPVDPPMLCTAREPCATPRKLQLTPSPGCSRMMGRVLEGPGPL